MARSAGAGRRTCESCPSLDVRELQREGKLAENRSFSVWWSGYGQIICQSFAWELVLHSPPGEFSTKDCPGQQRINLFRPRCRYGGSRTWFVCPCGRTVAILYWVDDLFACRRCHNLAYRSQGMDAHLRNVVKRQAIRKKLGGGSDLTEPLPARPRGMRRRTYWRLQAQALALEQRSLTGMMAFLKRYRRFP
jgi:hypothetical protein